MSRIPKPKPPTSPENLKYEDFTNTTNLEELIVNLNINFVLEKSESNNGRY